MKKNLLKIAVMSLLAGSTFTAYSQRYLTEVFPTSSITADVIYGTNISIITGAPASSDLKMDVYEPAGIADPLTARPMVIVMHTGSYLPPIYNGQPTGSRKDSTVAEMCRQFSRRGYVAVAMSYRLGWNPQASGPTGQDIRTGTLLQAVYRSIQDAKACVRYFKENAQNGGNTYGVDTNKITLGGVGTGGYVALAYATLNNPIEIALPKFLANATDATYGFVAGQPYVNQAALGDFDGYGGIPTFNNPNNSPGHTNNVQFVINMGGAMGDSSWIEAGDAPMLGFHVVSDPFAPYGNGTVYVPTTGDPVVDVSGSLVTIDSAYQLGNNNCFATTLYTDPYTLRANSVNTGIQGLFPFITPGFQAGPWEWFDSTGTVLTAQALGLPASAGTSAYSNSLLTNPDMSKAKALAYIDTIMGYSNPRMVTCMNFLTGIEQVNAISNAITISPNPATDRTEILSDYTGSTMQSIRVYDMLGKELFFANRLNTNRFILERNQMKAGIYLVKIQVGANEITKKVVFR